MNEYIILLSKCILFYFIVIFALRLMGKREIGELSIFDIVIYLVMSELLALSISEPNESMFKTIIPIFTLSLMQLFVSIVTLKFKKLRDIMDGIPVIIIKNGILLKEKMKKNRYSIDDLMAQIRVQGYSSPSEIEYAILENNGTLSVLSKKQCIVEHPKPLINDGLLQECVLKDTNRSKEWLDTQLLKEGIGSYDKVFLCIMEKQGLYIIRK